MQQPGSVSGKPCRLALNAGKSFQGSIVLGMGYVLKPEEANLLIEKNSRNRDVLFPYLNGDDLTSRWDQSPSRWVINFRDWPIERAMEYRDCFEIIDNVVRPERTRRKETGGFQLRYPLYERWWHYGEKRPELYATIATLDRVLVGVRHTKFWSLAVCTNNIVFSDALVVLAIDTFDGFCLLSSSVHEAWAREYSGSLETRLRYAPSDCFETFPFPDSFNLLEAIGQRYQSHRSKIMAVRREGITETYNRFHTPHELSHDIAILRALHVEMDHAVAGAYGWTDLILGHSFHETKQGIRYTVSEAARREVIDRLLALNHERYAAEQSAAAAAPRPKAKTRKRAPSQPGLF